LWRNSSRESSALNDCIDLKDASVEVAKIKKVKLMDLLKDNLKDFSTFWEVCVPMERNNLVASDDTDDILKATASPLNKVDITLCKGDNKRKMDTGPSFDRLETKRERVDDQVEGNFELNRPDGDSRN